MFLVSENVKEYLAAANFIENNLDIAIGLGSHWACEVETAGYLQQQNHVRVAS